MPRTYDLRDHGSVEATAADTAMTAEDVRLAARTPSRVTGLLAYAGLAAVVGMIAFNELKLELLPLPGRNLLPQPYIGNAVAVAVPGYVLVADVAAYQDELFSYLMFDYLRRRLAIGNTRLLLTFDQRKKIAPYRIVLVLQNDMTVAISHIAGLPATHGLVLARYGIVSHDQVGRFELQTRLFDGAYNLPVRRKLEQIPSKALSDYLQRFIAFKSRIDPRVRRKLEPVPQTLSSEEAQRLAGDIITVAEFYSLPLEFFLGIGAMENNYMNVQGDLKHSIWKRRATPDDVVLERRHGRVRVLNDSAGVWQITRETLRYAHKLYKKDDRDYTMFPEHLQPPEELAMNDVSPQVLTTYAGLLLRDLLDRFDGDVTLAVSAYNGGPSRPNLRYGEGVHKAAEHARRVIEQAAALNGESVVQTTWLRRPL
jgi:hypothetical protein